MMRMKCLCTALLIGLLACSSASAALVVSGGGGTYGVGDPIFVTFTATFDESVVGWNVDVAWDETYLGYVGYTIGADWDEGAMADDPGVLDLGAISFEPFPASPSDLFTLEFTALAVTPGTDVTIGADDVDEGFIYETGPLVMPAPNTPATIVIPEPATLSLLAFGALALIRRR